MKSQFGVYPTRIAFVEWTGARLLRHPNYVAQALKDVLPYLLGAVTDDYVKKREELRRLREKLRNCERRLAELAALRGDGVSKAATLLAQARDRSLTIVTESNNWEAVVAALRTVASTPLAQAEERTPSISEFSRLSEARSALLDEYRRLREQIAAARTFKTDEKSFSREATEQQARLKSIGIFEGTDLAMYGNFFGSHANRMRLSGIIKGQTAGGFRYSVRVNKRGLVSGRYSGVGFGRIAGQRQSWTN